MGRVKLDGNLDEELLEAGWIACQVTQCVACRGSGWSECGHVAEGKPGDRFYSEAVEGTKCSRCEGTGYILDLDTAIACKVRTTVEVMG